MKASNLHAWCVAFGGVLVTGVLACGSESSTGASAGGADYPPEFGSGGTTNASGGASSTAGTTSMPPPEMEVESSYRAPIVTGHYVWSANPESGRIAVIDPETLIVRLVEAGFQPTELAALPGDDGVDRAIVLNEGSSDATVLEATSSAVTAAPPVPAQPGANAWAVSPSGHWAVAWANAARLDAPDPADSFQDLTVLDLATDPPGSFALSVGYRPSSIVFSKGEKRVFVVTEPGLSVITLGSTPHVDSLIDLTPDPLDNPASRDVSITPDGALALVRVDGSSSLHVVDLETSDLESVDLGAPITDLDLLADGSRAFAVVGTDLIALSVPPKAADLATYPRQTFEGETLRSVSVASDASFSVVYTNAFADSHLGTTAAPDAWNGPKTRVLDVKAPVTSALISPSGEHAVVVGSTPAGSTKAGAFAIVPAQTDRTVKIVGTDAPITQIAFSKDGTRALLATRDDARGAYGAYVLTLESLQDDFVPLASPPSSVGIVPNRGMAFISQLHPEGRITFVDLATADVHTLTGFELAAKVTEH